VSSRKLIRRLKKFERLEVLHKLRKDDTTCAYYCEETEELVLFVDIMVSDLQTHHEVWGYLKEREIEDFTVKYLSRVMLHELMHWAGIIYSRTCEFVALSLTFDTETASIISGWLYPREKRCAFIVVEIDEPI